MLTETAFRSYVDAFNRSDFDTFSSFYAPNVEFRGRAGDCHSRAEIVALYRDIRARVREKITLHAIVIGENTIVADAETELYALVDWPALKSGALKAGETRRSENFLWYDVADNQFTRIRSAHHRVIPPGTTVQGTVARDDKGMTPEQYATYVDAFNRDDKETYGSFYNDDVLLNIAGKRELRGRQAIFDFYGIVKAQTRRTIEINKVIASGNQLAAELQSEFLALEYLPNFTAGPMKKGDRIFINTVALCELRDGKFARIRSGELKKIHRPG
jgi:ketosteroid isomerase-like protein